MLAGHGFPVLQSKKEPKMSGIFTPDEVMLTPRGKPVTKSDPVTGRTIVCDMTYFGGHMLTVRGPGVPGEICVQCESEFVNVLARALLDVTFDGNLLMDLTGYRGQTPQMP